MKVSDYMMFLLIPYVRKNEMIDLDVEIYQHLNEQIKINKHILKRIIEARRYSDEKLDGFKW